MRHNKDILWKSVLESVGDDLLRFVFKNAEEVFDLDREIVFLDKELSDLFPEPYKRSDVRFVDNLVKVYRKDGGEEWLLIHIEVQGRSNAGQRLVFPERMFRYFYRSFDRWRRPMIAIAIFCGEDQYDLADCYRYDLMGTTLKYTYNCLRIRDYRDEDLGASTNPFAWVMLAAKQALLKGKDLDNRLLDGKLFIFRKLYENGLFERKKLQGVFSFLKNYVRFEDPEVFRKFELKVDEITQKSNTMDMSEAVAIIRVHEKEELFVQNLLKETAFSDDKIARLAGVSAEFVEEVKEDMMQK